MSTTNIYSVEFAVVKKNIPPFSGKSHQYRYAPRTVLVAAATDQGIQAVLNADVPIAGGESIDILSSQQVSRGTEPAVLT